MRKDPLKIDIVLNGGQKIIPKEQEIIPGQPWAVRDEAKPLQPKKVSKETPKKWWHKYISWFIWCS